MISICECQADRAMTQELFNASEGRPYDTVIRKDLNVSEEDIEKLCSDMEEVALTNCKNAAQRQSVKNVTKNVLLNLESQLRMKKGLFIRRMPIFS